MGARRNSPGLKSLGAFALDQLRAPPLPKQGEMLGMETNDAAVFLTQMKRSKKQSAEAKKKAARDFEFQIRALELPKPAQYINSKKELSYEFRYCDDTSAFDVEPREFRADYAWPQYRLLMELQGGIWQQGGGGHSHPLGIERDITKQQYAALLGWFVLPITTDQVKDGTGVAWLQRVLIARGWKQ